MKSVNGYVLTVEGDFSGDVVFDLKMDLLARGATWECRYYENGKVAWREISAEFKDAHQS